LLALRIGRRSISPSRSAEAQQLFSVDAGSLKNNAFLPMYQSEIAMRVYQPRLEAKGCFESECCPLVVSGTRESDA